MGKPNYIRILAMIAFVALAAISCKWTAESLYMWHPDLTVWGAWTISVLSFIVASLCFSQLLRALDQNEDFYGKLFGRAGAFIIGLLGLIFFWVCVSLPTNTHTLLYGANIKTVLTQDLARTKGYLSDLEKNNQKINLIESQKQAVTAQIYTKLQNMQFEIEHPGHEGIGHRFDAIITDIEGILSQAIGRQVKIQRAARVGSNAREWNNTYKFYQTAVLSNLDIYNKQCQQKIQRIKEAMGSRDLNVYLSNLIVAQDDVNKMKGVNDAVIEVASHNLTQAYSYIKQNAEYINFNSDEDRARYTAEFPHTDAEDLLNVEEVVKDYIKTDRYKGMGYWILIALLVDIAGFVFFNIAFNKKNNNAF